MANHPSAKKRNRQNQKRRARNFANRSRVRTAIKNARMAISENAENKDALVKAAIREVYRTASKNVLAKNAASRTVSRLMRAAGR